jgi:hypothetical protein
MRTANTCRIELYGGTLIAQSNLPREQMRLFLSNNIDPAWHGKTLTIKRERKRTGGTQTNTVGVRYFYISQTR